MKRRWIVLISVGSFLLGAFGIYAGFTWLWPMNMENKEHMALVDNEVIDISGLEKVVQAYDLIQTSYVEEVKDDQLVHGAIQGMIHTLGDPYSVYMDEATAERFNDSFDTTFDGIGAQIAIQDGKLIIISPIKNSPAEKAGLKARDQITKIDGKSVEGLDIYEASKRIRGKKGTVVELEIIRAGLTKPIVLKITRDEVPLLTVFSDVKESAGKKIGYIEITSFSEGTAKDFAIELKHLEEKGIDGLILDVRGNPGGMLSSVEAILLNLVTGEKPYVQLEERSGKKNSYFSELKEKKPYPIRLLIDEGSASASEILAAAMKEINGYALIGTKTFGKGTVQQAVPLEDGSNIKLTMFKWLTPDGNWIHGKGIEPTIEVKQPPYYYSHALQLESTLERDMNNENVKIAQEMLAGLGFAPGRQDGYFDAQTEQAVRAFQSIAKIPVTGSIDKNTAIKLEEKISEAVSDEKNDLQLQVALKSFNK